MQYKGDEIMCEQCNDNAQCNDHAQCNCDTLDVTEILSLPELQKISREVEEETKMLDYDDIKKEIRGYDLIFLSHPFADDPKVNKKRVDFIAKEIRSNNPNAIILSPLHSFSYFDTDDMRDAIMYECYMMIARADTCVFIQYDGFLSSGQSDEILYAEMLDKNIKVEEIDQLLLDKKLGIR
jgi:hypothetical protein